jgi:hypothetical protein
MVFDGTSWTIVATPDPAGSTRTDFAGVSCTAASACVAVGQQDDPGVLRTLAAVIDGTAVSIQTSADPDAAADSSLHAVSCTDADFCVAVGSHAVAVGSDPLVEAWDGSAWSIQAAPAPAGAVSSALVGVSCRSQKACVAVGEYFSSAAAVPAAFAERWNGAGWAAQAIATPARVSGLQLSGVSCASSTACTAVGSRLLAEGQSIVPSVAVEAYDGTTWSAQATPEPTGGQQGSQLSGVSCTSAQACTAVGSYESRKDVIRALAERWNGSVWRVEATPEPSLPTGSPVTAWTLGGVSCSSARSCIAVGDVNGGATPLAESWNGSTWDVQPTPQLAGPGGSGFEGVSCSSGIRCTAVGVSSGGTLAEGWDGKAWEVDTTVNPAGFIAADLAGVSCPASGCTAVGSTTFNNSLISVPTAEAQT